MADKPSWLHRSNNWGGKPHVDIGKSHGHSQTLNPPGGVSPNGTINLGSKKDLPPPYGKVR